MTHDTNTGLVAEEDTDDAPEPTFWVCQYNYHRYPQDATLIGIFDSEAKAEAARDASIAFYKETYPNHLEMAQKFAHNYTIRDVALNAVEFAHHY